MINLQFPGTGYRLLESAKRQKIALAWEQQQSVKGIGPLWADPYSNRLIPRKAVADRIPVCRLLQSPSGSLSPTGAQPARPFSCGSGWAQPLPAQ